MKAAYPVFIKEVDGQSMVYLPDIESNTQGKDFYDAIYMARDALGIALTYLEDEGKPVPTPSSPVDAKGKAKMAADELLDFTAGILTYVDVDTVEYRNNHRSVRKNCTIPYWLNKKAERQGINFSQVLQQALLDLVE